MKIHEIKGTKFSAVLVLLAMAAVVFFSAAKFMAMRHPGPLVDMVKPAKGFKKSMLSNWFAGLKGTPADTEVYVQTGAEPGGTVLLLGGTHSNEPAAQLASVLILENARLEKGRLIVIPFANPMNRSHTYPQDAHPQTFAIKRPGDRERVFRFGSRMTNPVYDWPNPDIYIHPASGQQLAGSERGNLNRCYPGRPDGSLTERLAYGILQLIKKEKVDLAIDLHEASPEYPVVNAVVAHERAMELAAMVMMEFEGMGIPMKLEPSPKRLRGLSHREWGDASGTLAILMETANPSQGRLRGRTDEALILTGRDKAYMKAMQLGQLYIPYKGDQTIDLRVARHVTAVDLFVKMLGDAKEGREVVMEGIPSFKAILHNKVGSYLAAPGKPGA